jgi:hypothetical protein
MSLSGDSDQPPDDENIPSHNPPWPFVNPFTQGRLERKFLAEGATIDFDKLPKMQWWAPFVGLGDIFRVTNVLVKLELHSRLAHRPLTQPEAEAVAQYAAYTSRAYSWTPVAALGIGAWATIKGRKTFKFPFYKPKMIKFDPNAFPSKTRPIVVGPQATTLWHILRFTCYSALLMLPSTLFFSSYADTTFQAYAARDGRLKGLIEDIRRNVPEGMRRKTLISHPDRPQDSEQASDNAYKNSTQEYGSTASGDTPASWPSSTPVASSLPRTQRLARTGSGGRSDDDHSDLFDDDDDDASPVARSARQAEAVRGSSSSSGSSWDRVRQQAMSGSSTWTKGDSSGQEEGWAQLRQDKTRTPKEAKLKADEYSYSKEDEEREARNYEKEKAQKEFDALLEAERHGENAANATSGWRRK